MGNNKSKKKKKKSGWKIVLVVLLLMLLGIGTALAIKTYQNGGGLTGFLATLLGHNEETKKSLPEFQVLLMGVSTDIDVELTDTIMVASYNPNTQQATLLSIPRDTFIGSNQKKATGYDKINAVYSQRGAEGTLAEVNELTGLNIQHYAVVRTEALVKLVDAIGGVTFNVPIDMKYDDPSQDLYIDLQAGEQVIDGEKAEQLLRFRHNNNGTSYSSEYGDNDTGRMRTQREFIYETMKQTLKVENIFKLGEIMDIAKENIETNINFDDAKDYIPYLVEFKTENLISDTLPGENKLCNELWFFVADEEKTAELVNKLFNKGTTEAIDTTDTNNTTNTSNTTNEVEEDMATKKAKIKVEMYNGTEGTESFEKAMQALKDAGYNVTESKTNSSSKKSTSTSVTSKTIISNRKYADAAIIEEIKTILGTGDVSNNSSSTSSSDIYITLGTDYK